MSFLNPSILLALTAISIPVIIHLLNLRKIKKVEFSTLMFLKEVQKSKMRRIKIRQLLLLLFRILAIGFLVLSFSRPVYNGYAGNSLSDIKSTALIFIDDSFSMNSRDNNGMYLSQAIESVKKILSLHKESDDIYFIPFSKIGLNGSKIQFDSHSEIFDSLKNLKTSDKYTSILEILNFAEELLIESKNPVKEVHIISDFQKSNFSDPENKYNINLKIESIIDNPVNFFLLDIGSREINNLSVDNFIVKSKILEKDKDIKLKIDLNNFSKYSVKNKTVNLIVENELKAEKVVDAESFGKKEIEFKFKPGKTGFVNGYAELVQSEFSEDELVEDNKYYFNLFIPDKFTINFVEDNPADFKFIELAFKSASEFLSDSSDTKSALFDIVREKNISENIFKSDAVFVSNKKSFTEAEADILKDYISNGGGLFIFLGANADIENYNKVLFSKLNSIRIEKLNSERDNNTNLKFNNIDFENPLMSEIFKNNDLNVTSEKYIVESPEIKSFYELLLNENSKPVITMSNNKPFLAETDFAKGKIIISSVSATDDLSDFPARTIFLPIVIRSLYYLGNNFQYQQEYVIGNNNLVSVKGIKNISSIILPDKKSSILNSNPTFSEKDQNFVLIPYSEVTKETGEYKLLDSSETSSAFSLNYNSLESDIGEMSKDELKSYFSNKGIQNVTVITGKTEIENTIKESRTGLDLWKYMLMTALLFIIAEILLSRKLENS